MGSETLTSFLKPSPTMTPYSYSALPDGAGCMRLLTAQVQVSRKFTSVLGGRVADPGASLRGIICLTT